MIECRSDRSDSSIHHVGRRNKIRSRLNMGNRHAGQHLDGLVVHDLFVFYDTIVAIGGIRIQGHIGHHQ